jgi:predicted Zn-dependent protease with MMP-like domain
MMRREKFVKLVGEVLDTLPARVRERVQNVAVLVENVPPDKLRRGSPNTEITDSDNAEKRVLGVFAGVPTTQKSVFDIPLVPSGLYFIGRISAGPSTYNVFLPVCHLTSIKTPTTRDHMGGHL